MLMPDQDEFTIAGAPAEEAAEAPSQRSIAAVAISHVLVGGIGILTGVIAGVVFAILTGLLDFGC